MVLVGLMGSGKSVLGRQLAKLSSVPLFDLDEMIVEQQGASIPQIFKEKGEKGFRTLESECLRRLIDGSTPPQVVATGGGAILSPENRALMKEKGKVIWLDASPEILAARISGDVNRPLLHDVDPLVKMVALAKQRNPLYEEVADLRVDTGKLSDQEAVAKIIEFLS